MKDKILPIGTIYAIEQSMKMIIALIVLAIVPLSVLYGLAYAIGL